MTDYERLAFIAQQCNRLTRILKILDGKGPTTICIGTVPGDHRYKGGGDAVPGFKIVDLLAPHRTATGMDQLRQGLQAILEEMQFELTTLVAQPRHTRPARRRTRITPDRKIPVMELSMRARNSLENADIKTLNELMCWTLKDLRRLRGLGTRTLSEIRDALDGMGLMLCPDRQQDQFDNSRQRQRAYRKEIATKPGENDGA